MVNCPVCGTPVDDQKIKQQTSMTSGGATETDPKAGTRQFHDGAWYYFDSLACRTKFFAAPDSYAKP